MKPERRAIGALLCLSLLSSCTTPAPLEAVPTGRLPSDTRPIEVRLELEIDPGSARFAGRVEIEIELDRARSTLWLHALDLDVHAAHVVHAGERIAARFEIVDSTGVAAVRLEKPIGPGRARLDLEWDAAFAPGLRGLYRVERGDDDYAFTQMEPIDARRAFPGFDEPAFKVPFEVSLIVPGDLVALANTPEIQTEWLDDGRVRRRYARTPPMPTYLLAWAVGPLEVVEAPPIPPSAVRAHALPLRGVAARGRGEELDFALAATPAILEAVEAYAGSAYPYAKLDVVAVPDFSAGAMENIGLVTFRDGLLLLDPDTAPVGQRRAFAGVMAHELVHMWFGNLVTMPWWDDIWLNEAFATWLGSRTIAELYPEHASEIFQLHSTHGAMSADSLASARRVREPIRSTHDIRNAFDAITYRKGGAILAMFEAAAGRDVFQRAVRAYLERHAFGTATSNDFLAVVASEIGQPFASAMRSFLDQPGLPTLAVEARCVSAVSSGDSADSTGERYEWSVSQARYRPLGSTLDASGIWSVPVCPAGGSECSWIESQTARIVEDRCRPWLHPNPGAAGYYRWTLPPDALANLLGLGWPTLSVLERMSLADALKASYATGALGAAEVFAAFEKLAADPARPVATAPLSLLREARLRLATTEAERGSVERYVRSLYAERARSLGFDDQAGDDGERKLLRASLISAVVVQGRDEALRAEAFDRGRRHLLTPAGEPDREAASPELLGLVTRIAVEEGGREEFEAASAHLFASEDSIVRNRMLQALASARDPELVEAARALVFDPRIRSNERMSVIHTQAARAESLEEREAVFGWVRQRVDAIVEEITLNRATGLLGAANGFCSRVAADQIDAWFGQRIDSFPGGPRRLAGLVERVRLCAARTEYQRDSARGYFARQDKGVL